MDDLEWSKAEASKALKRLPAIFGYNVSTKLELKVAWFIEYLGCCKATAGKALKCHPALFTVNSEKNLEPKAELLLAWFSREEVVDLVASFAPILAYRKERLQVRGELLLQKGLLTPARLKQGMTLGQDKFEAWYAGLEPEN